MARYEIDGMAVDQILYWYDQPVVYLGRVVDGDERPCLVVLVSDGRAQVYHRLRFSSEVGLRRTLASGAAPTRATYALAEDLARLQSLHGGEPWVPAKYGRLVELDGPPTALPPSRSTGDVPMPAWRDDHWTLLRYLAERQRSTPHGGIPLIEYQRLRINPQNHLVQAAAAGWICATDPWTQADGTLLPGTELSQIGYHDDFDCLEEFEAEGLLDIVSTATGAYRMTPAGIALADSADEHLARTGSCLGLPLPATAGAGQAAMDIVPVPS